MKVAITGHTRGIGKKISEYFISLGYEIVGLSKSTGSDLSIEKNKTNAISKIIECDIFVNNAFVSIEKTYSHHSYVPVEILFEVHKAWKNNPSKKIFVIGSMSSSLYMTRDYGYGGYQISKMALDKSSWLLSHASEYPMIHLLKPGRVDTDMVKNRMGPKMKTGDLIPVIDFCMKHSNTIYIREIAFDPGSDYFNTQ
jgi:NAD(P)-dependent dehydrogenase (short-subunit alcohol dehydrogenase family)